MSADRFTVRLVDYGSDADLVAISGERRIQGVADAPEYPVVLASDYDALRDAAQAVIDRWDTPLWKDVPATAEHINRLRAVAAGQHIAGIPFVDDPKVKPGTFELHGCAPATGEQYERPTKR